MAHNIMRVDSMHDRYVTETMIDLNLDLNEEIDFDFFDNADTPNKVPLTDQHQTVDIPQSRSCSPQDFEDDDDVQINPHLLGYDLRLKNVLLTGEPIKDFNSSSDSIEGPISTGKENEDKCNSNFDECESNTVENTNAAIGVYAQIDNSAVSLVSKIQESLEPRVSTSDATLCSKLNECQTKDETLNSYADVSLMTKVAEENKNATLRKSDLSQELQKSSENHQEDALSFKQDGEASEDHNEQTSSKSSTSQKSEGSRSGYDSDEGCPLEGSDSDELLLGVHTLTIIPRENEECAPQKAIPCEEADKSNELQMIHTTSCEKAAMTARSSSGYSSASCKAHGCIVSRGPVFKAESRHCSQMKVQTPDMDEFVKSFQKVQTNTPVSFMSSEKYAVSKKRKRRNMSFSNEELQRIERENAILLNKIVLQQRARPSVVHKYERRVTSNAINRARQLKKIECDNEILLRKIQGVKRNSSSSAHNSRCISQASTSQFSR